MVSSSREGATPISTTTGPNGAYAFANQEPGSYSVTVSSLAQHSDGAHTAGSAGGTVGVSSIDGIVLQASEQATGYLFAKVPIPPDPVADLQVTALTASTTTPRESEEFALTLQVANAGPDAAVATAAWYCRLLSECIPTAHRPGPSIQQPDMPVGELQPVRCQSGSPGTRKRRG